MEGAAFMVQFLGYLLPCIIFSYILFAKRKAYSLVLSIFYILNLLGIFVLRNLSNMEITILFTIEIPLFIMGVVLFYKDYKKNKK